jgi:splicing factor 3B subunit 4
MATTTMSGLAGGRITVSAGTNTLGQHSTEKNPEATLYVGNLDPQMDETLLWELFIQCGPVASVYVPKDRVTSSHQGYAFVEMKREEDCEYAVKILNMIKVFGKPIRVNKASNQEGGKGQDVGVGANLFVGNLDSEIDEKMLYDTFSAFGSVITAPKVQRDPDTGESRGFGFVQFDSFEASDRAIEAMHGQFLAGKQITVVYAYKKDTNGERHGSQAERLLAQAGMQNNGGYGGRQLRPHAMFSDGSGISGFAGMGVMPGGGMPGGMPPPPPPPGMMMMGGGGMPGMPPPPPPPGMMVGMNAAPMAMINQMQGGMPPPPPPPPPQ